MAGLLAAASAQAQTTPVAPVTTERLPLKCQSSPRTKSWAELRTEKSMKKAEKDVAKTQQMMGNTGYGAAPTPSAKEGGTPQ